MPAADLSADILPGEGLGGIALGVKGCDVQEELFSAGVEKEWVSSSDLRYHLGDGEIEVGFDPRIGVVVRLTARAGYRGKLLGRIAVGMTLEEAEAAEPRVRRESDGASIAGVPGVVLELRGPSHARVIEGIAVFRG
ncbi:MAG: hypothetical protein HYY18_15970 [Planctomycetes bacterium]|nr:hypothetical protein [Planctomycetota bacterium]